MKMIIRVLLVASAGIGILILIPDLFLPVLTQISNVIDTNFINVMMNIYMIIPDKLLTLMQLQFGTLLIIMIIKFIMGGK
jgi:hypothetical protein